jgi:microcystin-dependent protein
MAAMWPLSLMPQYDANGTPYAGAKAYFYQTGTSTPQTTYTEANLGISHDHPVEADANGRFPAVFFNPANLAYRVRVTDAADQVIPGFDVDDIDIPLGASYTPPDAGETSVELLFRTGDLKARYGTGTHSGWVRANGRTVGSASSGASERANADAEDLFEHLWNADANLAVSSGRGANAAADWAANKNIALPDYRDRVIVGLGDMGNSDANRIADSLTNDDNITLGATAGSSTVTLTEAQLAAHDHTATFTGTPLAAHSHTISLGNLDTGGGVAADGSNTSSASATSSVSAGTPAGTITVDNAGGGEAHPNIQPSMFATIYVKL